MSSNNQFRVAVIGCSWLAAETLRRLDAEGVATALITEPEDRLAARAAKDLELPCTVKPRALPLLSADLPWRPDLVISAHSFRIVPGWFIEWARLGAIGYHPSILPAYKGRNAIRDCLADDARFTGGTVYWLTDAIDGGPAVIANGRRLQDQVQILPGETAMGLWRRALAPMGADLLAEAVQALAR
ncbi:methionyl-tRNA formyltransferase [Parasedimentitalea marina]|uniref:Methionyl-tRNA formyltransferase n=1 Tax=Parasedimentitalea marina TaxID=2483033 RepID=A0A3T0N1Q7_9RHOB|nr:formyltransferase family protein [Parasedimentitalea marina]AZV77922.1 methionyl-tRNA formyltransferase [Parasedimentitalea marina]